MSSDRPEKRQNIGSLCDVIARYLEAIDSGANPDRDAWIARYPEFGFKLVEFFEAESEILRIGDVLQPPAPVRGGRNSISSRDSLRSSSGSAGPTEGLPRTVGRYELREEIARGGMGVVYKAEQWGTHRTVAVKMLHRQRLVTAADIARFRTEAQAAAKLDHPNIVPVYEVGQHEGEPYLVMKLIEGPSLAREIARYVKDPRGAAQLAIQIARGVHCAHQHGVLHRDLKPGNILLETDGRPRIADFGLAKLLDVDSTLTQTGLLVGTPSYVAPEQTFGDTPLTTAVDVYGLGAILYCLLTGQPPFHSPIPMETLRKVQLEEPKPLRTLNRRVHCDLETICLRCLQKDPARRYGSAEALADDLERWLDGKPITARPVGPGARLGKWIRRRPAAAALVAVSILSASSLLISGIHHNVQLRTALERAENERSRALDLQNAAESQRVLAEDARRRAKVNFRRARDVVDRMLTRVGDAALAKVPQAAPVRRALLEDALEYYQQFLSEKPHDLSVQGETARAYRRVGTIRAAFGQSNESEKAFRQAIALLEELIAKTTSTVEHHLELAANHRELAMQLFWATRYEEVERERRKQLEHLRQAVELAPEEPSYQRRLATCYTDVGLALQALSHPEEAEPYMRRAVTIRRQLEEDFPRQDSGAWHSHLWLGALLFDLHRFEEAEHELKRAVQGGGGPQAENYLGRAQFTLGKFDDALATQLHAVETRAARASESPYTMEDRRRLGWLYESAADPLIALERYDEAEAYLRQSLALREQLVTDFPEVVTLRGALAWCYERLGILLYVTGRQEEAAGPFRRAISAYEAFLIESPNVQGIENLYARFLVSCPERTLHDSRRAIELGRKFVAAAPESRAFWCTLGVALCRGGQYQSAVEALQTANQFGAGGGSTEWYFLAICHAHLGDIEQAEHWYQKAVGAPYFPISAVGYHYALLEPLRREAKASINDMGIHAQSSRGLEGPKQEAAVKAP